jgi:hypothetical protein
MAHIDRRDRNGAIRYVARYIAPTGQERSKSFTRRPDAHKYLTEIEGGQAQRQLPRSERRPAHLQPVGRSVVAGLVG